MSDKQPRVVDGADRRKARLLAMLQYMHTQGGCTSQELQAFMTMRYGLKWSTTAKYIQELHLSKLITQGGVGHIGKWFTTGKYKSLAKYLYGEGSG